jgi:transcriptional regulator with XRE-family HTH domain
MCERRHTPPGTTIAGLREQRGWSQHTLAKVIGLGQPAVSRIEAGRRRVTTPELEALARALGVTPTRLLEAPPVPAAQRQSHADRGSRRIDREALLLAVDDADAVYQRIHARRGALEGPSFPARETVRAPHPKPASDAGPGRRASAIRTRSPRTVALPQPAEEVIASWFALRALNGSSQGDECGPRDSIAHPWSQELRIDPGGPVPDLIPLLEDAAGVEIIVARLCDGEPPCGCAVRDGAAFLFVNAARPVILQRFALAHAFGHLVLGHGDVLEARVARGRGQAREREADDFAEELLAPAAAVTGWYDRHGDPAPDVATLIELANAFGISAWAAMDRSHAAHKLSPARRAGLTAELRRLERFLQPRQAFLGGLSDTLTFLSASQVRPGGAGGPPAILRVPARMRVWAAGAMASGCLSLETAAGYLCMDPNALALELEAAGIARREPHATDARPRAGGT